MDRKERAEKNYKILARRVEIARMKFEDENARKLRVVDIASMTGSDPKTINQILNGEYIDRRLSTIESLAKALKITYSEEVYWYGLTGHIPPTRMPSKDQVIDVLSYYHNDISTYSFPAYLMSCYLTYFAVNPATAGLVGSYDNLIDLLRTPTSVFDIIFDSGLGLLSHTTVDEIEHIRAEQLRRFFAINWSRRHEPYFQDYGDSFAQRLVNQDDKRVFNEMWNITQEKGVEHISLSGEQGRYILGYFTLGVPKNELLDKLSVRVSAEPIYELGGLFELVHYRPANETDYDTYKKYFDQFCFSDAAAIENLKIWSHPNINISDILRSYQTT